MIRCCPCLLFGGLKLVLEKVLFVETRSSPPTRMARCKIVSEYIDNKLHEIQDCQCRKEGIANACGSVRELKAI